MGTVHIQSKWAVNSLQLKLTDLGFQPDTDEIKEVAADDDVKTMRVTLVPEQESDFIECLTHFMLEDWKRQYLLQYLSAEFRFLESDQLEYLALLSSYVVQSRADGYAENLDHTLAQIEHDFRAAFTEALTSGWIDIQGIVQFRARNYLRLLEQAAVDMVEQFLSDREYEEFVSMLRYMLESNPPSAETLHVFCTDERVWICDDDGELYTDPEVEDAAKLSSSDDDVNAEDLAMSILVTKSPCRIVIHDLTKAAPWPSFAETCERVFLYRAERCNDCSTCQTLVSNQSYT